MVASKRKVRQRECTSKKRFDSEEEARYAIARWDGRVRSVNAPERVGIMTIYRCPFSNPYREHYHAGHDKTALLAEVRAARRTA